MPLPEHITSRETPANIHRYNLLKGLVGTHFNSPEDIDNPGNVREFLAEAATQLKPTVQATWWEHVFIATELGRLIDPETEAALLLHDIGRLVTPSPYLRTDLVGERAFRAVGEAQVNLWPEEKLLPLSHLLTAAEKMAISPEQRDRFYRGENPQNVFTRAQIKTAEKFFASLKPLQRITSLADNLGKKDQQGKLFTLETFITYLQAQEGRYAGKSDWSSEAWGIDNRESSAVLQAWLIQRTIEWLQKERGIDFESVRTQLETYAPKFILLVRHGEPKNPRGIVYNLDEVMDAEDIIHISDTGKSQMTSLAKLIRERQFRLSQMIVSNQTRARESADELIKALGDVMNRSEDESVRDIYAPGAYKEGLTMHQWQELKGNAYDVTRWGKYNHEKRGHIVGRMRNALMKLTSSLGTGETGFIVSHGDSIAWLIHYLKGKYPNPENLRDALYPPQGGAFVVVIGPSGKPFTVYELTDDSPPGKLY